MPQSSLAIFQANSKQKENRKYIMGRIVMIEAATATADHNPYRIPEGTVYYTCDCEQLIHRASGGGVTSPSWSSQQSSSNSSALVGAGARQSFLTPVKYPGSSQPATPATPDLSGSLPPAPSSSSSSSAVPPDVRK